MSNDKSGDDKGNDITVKRERIITQKESLTVKSKRGTGTNDRDEVRKFVEREAELDVPDSMLDQMPSLIGDRDEGRVIGEVAGTMAELRGTNNDDE